jgi:hypothetical protein
MPAILATVLRVFAGLGLGELLEKVLPGKVETPYAAQPNRMTKLLIFGAVVAAGAIAFSFISKKLKLKL